MEIEIPFRNQNLCKLKCDFLRSLFRVLNSRMDRKDVSYFLGIFDALNIFEELIAYILRCLYEEKVL